MKVELHIFVSHYLQRRIGKKIPPCNAVLLFELPVNNKPPTLNAGEGAGC